MNRLSSFNDNLASGLSAFCVMHCLASSLLITVLLSSLALQLQNEGLNIWLLIGLIPSSQLFLITVAFEEIELLEKLLTISVAGIVAMAHCFNVQSRRAHSWFECTTTQ